MCLFKRWGLSMARFLCMLMLLLFMFGIPIKVSAASDSTIRLNKTSVLMNVSDTKTLSVKGLGKMKRSIAWRSMSPKVVSVTQSGTLTARKPGVVKIKAVVNYGKSAKSYRKTLTAMVKVYAPKLNATSKTIPYKGSFLLRLSHGEANSFVSSNPKIASVDNGGLVSAKSEGTVVISCVDKNFDTYKCTITVEPCKHKYNGGAMYMAPTCTHQGSTIMICGDCGYKDITVHPAIGHNYSKEIIEPVKEHYGYTLYTCTRCEDSYEDDLVDWCPTKEDIIKVLESMRSEFYEGRHWTNDDFYAWDAGVFSGGYGCAGFCFILSDRLFGYLPVKVHQEFDQVRVGDIIRLDGDKHSVSVIARDGDRITVAEGNYDSSIHWGRQFSISVNSKNWDYVMTRYADAPGEGVLPPEYGAAGSNYLYSYEDAFLDAAA